MKDRITGATTLIPPRDEITETTQKMVIDVLRRRPGADESSSHQVFRSIDEAVEAAVAIQQDDEVCPKSPGAH